MSNEEQIAYWNGDAGRKWARMDNQMSGLLAPIAEALMEHAGVEGARAVLDVGCGGGSETLMLAARLAEDACILGIDVSAPLLEVAEQRRSDAGALGQRIRFLQADAQVHDFGDARFDLLFSRFGVMFFDAPAQAFAHMRAAMTRGGRLAVCCWQSLADNPWTALPLRAALTVLPAPPKPAPRTPGPFALAEHDYLLTILEDAGWSDIAIVPHAVTMRWAGHGDLAATARELVTTGPVGRLLIEASDEQRQAVYEAVAAALAPHFDGESLALGGNVWLVTARNED
jgi:ubiquinone/menaquinone biosynthesis C-methylase UbiE